MNPFLAQAALTLAAIASVLSSLEQATQDAQRYFNSAVEKQSNGDLDGAIADFSRAIDLDPKFAKAYNNRGNAHVALGQYDQAFQDFRIHRNDEIAFVLRKRPPPLDPFDHEFDEVVGDDIANVLEILGPEDFYKPAHRKIFDSVVALFGRGEAIDAVTVAEELRRSGHLEEVGGKPYLLHLVSSVPAASNAGYSHCAWKAGDGFFRVHNGAERPSRWEAIDFDYRGTLADSFVRCPPSFRRQGMRVLLSDLLWLESPRTALRRLTADAAKGIERRTRFVVGEEPPAPRLDPAVARGGLRGAAFELGEPPADRRRIDLAHQAADILHLPALCLVAPDALRFEDRFTQGLRNVDALQL